MEPMPVTGNARLDHFLAIVGIVMTLSSAFATFVNSKVRATIDAREEVPKLFLYVALVANYAALNIDKCAQLHRILRGDAATVLLVSAHAKGSRDAE